jgi:hypothetical protein
MQSRMTGDSVDGRDLPSSPARTVRRRMAERACDQEPDRPDLDEKRIRASSAAQRVGMSARRLVELAAKGRVPGAAQMAGGGGQWSFSLVKLEGWIREREAVAACRREEGGVISTVEVKSGGGGSRSADESTAKAFERLFGPKRKGTLPRGVRR